MSAQIKHTLFFVPFLCVALAAWGGASDSFELDGDRADGPHEMDGSTEAGGGEPPCEVHEFSLGDTTPNMMLVLDKSGSMNDMRWDDDGDPATAEVTRWHSLHGVVAELSTNYEGTMNLGVTLFPALDAGHGSFESSCAVSETPEVEVGAGSSAAILAAIPAADDEDFGGATPATAGVLTGVASLEVLGAQAPSAMVLITDGAANCADPNNYISMYDSDLPLAVADAWEGAGIATYVVGIDIGEDGGVVEVNPREALHEVAIAGGVARAGEVGFYDATDPAALEAALDEIGARLNCTVDLDLDPQNPIIVEVDGQTIPQVDSCAGTDDPGWAQLDPVNNPTKIELCNSACSDAEVSGGQASACPSGA